MGVSSSIMKAISRLSRVLHRWLGLGLVAYLSWMGGSGVLLNHPRLISGISVPEWVAPPQYRIESWNRGALRSLVPVAGRPGHLLAAGRLGVWLSEDGGRSFRDLNQGLGSLYQRNARQALVLAGASEPLFVVAAQGGLYTRGASDREWRRLPLGDRRPVVKVILVEDRLLVFTDSGVFVSPAPPRRLELAPAALRREPAAPEVSMVTALFDLHSGEAWGLPGQLVVDVVGVVLVVLSVSALITWLYRKLRRRLGRARARLRRAIQTFVRYHLDLGMAAALFLLLIGLTGMFMRPPLLALAAGTSIPRWAYPGTVSENPWHHKIRNATYDAANQRILIQADDGIWEGPPDLAGSFRRITLPVPVFAMGATVFEADGEGALDVGSFSGLFRIEADGTAVDRLTGEPAQPRSQMRPGRYLVTGFLRLPEGDTFMSTHHQGLLHLDGSPAQGRLPMPVVTGAGAGMPLWNFLFELHNGRIFRDLIGAWYVLVVPLGGLGLVLLTLTGVWDWTVPRWPPRKPRFRRGSRPIEDEPRPHL